MAQLPELEVYAKTLYAEARGEPVEGQEWVAWVIKNRAHKNRSYWGGSNIKDVCLKPYQFSCWNGQSDIPIKEPKVYEAIQKLTKEIYDADMSDDPTSDSCYYHSKNMPVYPSWTKKVHKVAVIGNHIFYRD